MSQEAWGQLNDRLEEKVLVGLVKAALEKMQKMLALHDKGQQTNPESIRVEIEAVVGLYQYLIKNPINFKADRVTKTLAALPNSIGGKVVLVNNEVAIHLGLGYIVRDYSDIVPERIAKERSCVLPVQVVRMSNKANWIDVVKATVEKVNVSEYKRHAGIYTKCAGTALTIGGTVTGCHYPDEARSKDVPRFRCSACQKEFDKIRARVCRTNRNGGVDNTSVLNEFLAGL
jgi:hypothetical protein